MELSRRTHSFASGTLRMPAPADAGWLIEHALAVETAIFAALCRRAIASRMCALLSLLFGHDKPPCPLFSSTASSRRQSSASSNVTSFTAQYSNPCIVTHPQLALVLLLAAFQ
jgi:hypothetical protein